MFEIARFQIIGRVGAIKPFDKTTRISVATNAAYKNENGARVDCTFWNEVVVFDRSTRGFIAKRLKVGDLVRVEGTLRQSSFEQNGEKKYATDLVVDELSSQPKKAIAEDINGKGYE